MDHLLRQMDEPRRHFRSEALQDNARRPPAFAVGDQRDVASNFRGMRQIPGIGGLGRGVMEFREARSRRASKRPERDGGLPAATPRFHPGLALSQVVKRQTALPALGILGRCHAALARPRNSRGIGRAGALCSKCRRTAAWRSARPRERSPRES